MIVCIGLVGVGVILLTAGVNGAWILLPVLGCMLMMWTMGGMRHGGDKR